MFTMNCVIKPTKKPPTRREISYLSLGALKTLRALEKKYIFCAFKQPLESARHLQDPSDYYQHIYDLTFKKEVESQPDTVFESMSPTPQFSWQNKSFENLSCNKDEDIKFEMVQSLSSYCDDGKTVDKTADTLLCIPRIEQIMNNPVELDSEESFCKNSPTQQNHYFQDGPDCTKSFFSPDNVEVGNQVSNSKHSPFILSDNFMENSKGKKILKKWKKKFGSISNLLNRSKKINARTKREDLGQPSAVPVGYVHHYQENTKDGFDIWSEDHWSQTNHCVESNEPIPVSSSLFDSMNHNQNKIKTNFSGPTERVTKRDTKECPCLSLDASEKQKFERLQLPGCSKSVFEKNSMESFDGTSDNKSCFKINEDDKAKKNLYMDLKTVNGTKSDNRKRRNTDVASRKANTFGLSLEIKPCNNNLDERSSLSCITEDPLCDSVSENVKQRNTVRKRGKDGTTTQKVVKKSKAGFKPPTKQNTILDYVERCSKEDSSKEAGLPDIVEFFNLSSDKQCEVKMQIKSTQQFALTMIYSNGKALVNNFNSAEDPSRVSSLILFTNEFRCYQLTIDSKTVGIVREVLIPILSSKECECVIVNSKEFLSCAYKTLHFDISQIICCEKLEDPVLASWLLNPDKPATSFSMMCQTARLKFTGVETDWLQCLFFTKKLMSLLRKRLEGAELIKLYKNIEMRLVPLLSCMESQSLRINIDIFRCFADILKSKLHKLEESIFKEVGHKFSINSHPQLRQVLYEELKLDERLPPKSKIGKTSVSHLKSTCESSLLLLSEFHPLPSIILEYRTLQKLKSTYIDGMLSCVADNSVSTHWDQTSAATGRLTSFQPNIQNVPKTVVLVDNYLPNSLLGSAPKSSAKIYAREPFICHEGFTFLSADFQQIELRILAHLSNDKALLSMFWNPACIDVFTLLTAEWKNITVETVSNEDREATKRIVYSVMYGVGKDKLADYLKVKPDVAKEIMQNFLARFPAIDTFTKKCCSYAKEHGFTKSICGRRRYFPYINSPSPALRAQAQRQAVNFCVQGSAADICKLAMLEVESSLNRNPELKCRLLLQIHDELLWEVADDQLYQVKEIIENVMENAKMLCNDFCSLQVPLAVSFSYGKSWAHLSPLNQYDSKKICDTEPDTDTT